MSKLTETWGKVGGFSGYRISSLGKVYRMGKTIIGRIPNGGICRKYVKGGIVSQSKNRNNKYGYYRVRLINDEGKKVWRYVHRLVAEAHLPDFAPHLEVDHRGTKEQCTVLHLEVVTRKENMKRCHMDNPHILENLKKGRVVS